MVDADTSMTARLTAIESILTLLLAEHIAKTPHSKRSNLRSSFFGEKYVPHNGLEDVEWLETVRALSEAHLKRLFDKAEECVRIEEG